MKCLTFFLVRIVIAAVCFQGLNLALNESRPLGWEIVSAYAPSDGISRSSAVPGTLVDTSFSASITEGSGYVSQILPQPNSKILVAGLFKRANNGTANSVARFNADGTVDGSFHVGAGANNTVWDIALQPDGKIILGGSFTSFNGQPVNRIVRLNSDGSIDPTFSNSVSFNGQIDAILVLPNGQILAGGQFSVSSSRLVVLNSDGSLSQVLSVFNGVVHALASAPDGKIVVGGSFSQPQPDVFRLNPDLTVDPVFDPTTGTDTEVTRLAVQSDGKILAGGPFNSFNGSSTQYLVRLNNDGTVDTTFEFTLEEGRSNIALYSIGLQSDGKILAGYYFGDSQRRERSDVVRFKSDGSRDHSFNSGSDERLTAYDISVLPDGSIFVGAHSLR